MSSGAAAARARMMLRRVVTDPAVAGAKCGTLDSDSMARSPRSPLDLRAFAALGGSLLRSPRSPRSWDSQRVGLGSLVDTLAEPAADAKNRLLGYQMRPTKLQCLAKSYASLPKDCGYGQPELGVAAGAGGMSVPCTRFYGDVKSGPEVTGGSRLGFSSHSVDLAKFPASGSLPVSIGGPRRYIGSVSAMEVEQSEDYTCIIAHGSNPKTTRIFGDCILEPCPLLVPDWESKETEEAELYWLVKGPGDADEEFMRVCFSCNRNLDGDESCIYRGNAFCSGCCKDQVILNEEEEEINPAASSPSSASSKLPFHEDDDIFIDGVVSGRADMTSVSPDT
ncbi:FCS-Like Zinc finger 10 isoform X2 [Lolium perenne]|uniref:FCS-Like Zinc finger 10 isoform X2 n=1 Tax=Lolium perenne TaxID=4522 RepID=UPI0021F4FFD4|nr:FCS-Like Zinc finger 10-like isoform X2 [Lolium perenne]